MGEPEGQLILNYIEEDLENTQDTNLINPEKQKKRAESTGSLDENQNRKEEPKIKTEKALIQKLKDNKEKINIKQEKDQGNTVQVPLPLIEIKKELEHQKLTEECEEIAVKYETVEAIHEEFKYESHNEEEDNKIERKKVKKGRKGSLKKKIKGGEFIEKLRVEILRSMEGKEVIVNANKSFKSKPKVQLFSCEKCLYVGNSKANLERHTLIHLDPSKIKWYNCSQCSYKSKYEYQLKSHLLIHKNPDEVKVFQCPHCPIKCSRRHNLTNHIKSLHSDRINSFQCADCSYKTFSKERMVAHVRSHSREIFSCKQCKFVTKRLQYLEIHIKMVHTEVERMFPCDTCSYKGKAKKELERHYFRMHDKAKLRVYKCVKCSFHSIYKKNFEFHMLHMHQNSQGFQKFICGHCKREFAYKSGLKVHIIRCHLKMTDEDWHKCLECRYQSRDPNTLKRHIKRNHCDPRLKCHQCSYTTNRRISMTAHKKSHDLEDDQQILKCPECPYRAVLMTTFFYHMKAIHGKQISAKMAEKYYLQDDE